MDSFAVRRAAGTAETVSANRHWWDAEAQDYYAEHGAFLGDADFCWGPEGLRESDAHLLGPLAGRDVLEIGAGSAQCSRWVAEQGARVVATDLSLGMLRRGVAIDAGRPAAPPVPLAQCDGRLLPFPDASFDVVFTAYGVVPFVADPERVMNEVCRVLRPGGRFAFSTTHPFRWAFPDEPDSTGLTVRFSYFDRTPYVEQDEAGDATYAEHHRTIGDRIRDVVAAGMHVVDIVEPEWPEANDQEWGGWSPLRGRLIPGTLIIVADKPR
ncbi:MAG TPA: class I SAM-dependent methyltransferase [Dermatophilaceae bacterium]|jgi:ubiquinone/menaquinone biosynthesis C-methylase UbiE|nr:class I SAM-dependent methyltransferase [Actinomycetales bacterium]HMT32783.1 class I SAM-dependent methyltransferase [Dermatophilaceae bacterium]HMT88905.1 class I SAM-dependent methyltransferase [Dermatophilaceae bacterium]